MDYFWCGTENGFRAVESAQIEANKLIAKGGVDGMPALPSLYNRVGSVGVIEVKGPLVSGDAGFMRYFGVTGYDNIREAIVAGLEDKGAKSLMLAVDSGGGAVNGVTDTASFIKAAGAIKPMSVYADNAASAAYWLASAGGHITAADTGITGSIGVLRVHTEYSQADAKDGITRTVLRAGDYKALVNPIEPLSDTAKAEVNAMLQDLYKSFVTDVAANRNVSYDVAHQKMAQGKEFLGQRALFAGLVDKVGNYESALAHAASMFGNANRGSSATSSVAKAALADNNSPDPEQGTNVKPTLTPEQMLAVIGSTSEQSTEAAIAAAAAVPNGGEASAAPNTEAIVAELTTTKETLNSVQAELDTTKAQLVEAQASIAAGSQAAIDAGESITALSAIVSAYISNMAIALNTKVDGLDAMTPKALCDKHIEMSNTFKSKFKAGGAAATTAEVREEPARKPVNPIFAAVVKSVQAK